MLDKGFRRYRDEIYGLGASHGNLDERAVFRDLRNGRNGLKEGGNDAHTQLRCRDPGRRQCRDGCHRGDKGGGVDGRHARAGSARRDLPQPRLHAEKGASRRGARARRDRARQGPSHHSRQPEPRLAGVDRPRKGDYSRHPGLARDADGAARGRGDSRPRPLCWPQCDRGGRRDAGG